MGHSSVLEKCLVVGVVAVVAVVGASLQFLWSLSIYIDSVRARLQYYNHANNNTTYICKHSKYTQFAATTAGRVVVAECQVKKKTKKEIIIL